MHMYLLECEGGGLTSSDLPDRQPLAVDAPDGDRDELPQGGGAQEQGVGHPDHPLHAGPRHHRTHALRKGRGGGRREEEGRGNGRVISLYCNLKNTQ